MYSSIFIIRFLFIFLFIFVLYLSSLTKSDIQEGATGDPTITPSTPKTSPPYITSEGRYYKTYADYYNATNDVYNIIDKDKPIVTGTKPTINPKDTKDPKATRDMFARDYSNPTDKKTIPKMKYNVGTPKYDKNIPKNINEVTNDSLNKYKQDISKDMNIEYHKSEDELRKELEQPLEMTYIYDKKGNKILYPSPKIQGNITYHVPGSYPFGSINYVPKYADSILLSKSTGLSTVTKLKNTAKMKGGFCTYYKNNPDKLEEYCKSTNVNKCASTNCCTLLGGSNCVAGNKNGPTNKSHYNDIYIRNKDYYYYQGKCYGNCV